MPAVRRKSTCFYMYIVFLSYQQLEWFKFNNSKDNTFFYTTQSGPYYAMFENFDYLSWIEVILHLFQFKILREKVLE